MGALWCVRTGGLAARTRAHKGHSEPAPKNAPQVVILIPRFFGESTENAPQRGQHNFPLEAVFSKHHFVVHLLCTLSAANWDLETSTNREELFGNHRRHGSCRFGQFDCLDEKEE